MEGRGPTPQQMRATIARYLELVGRRDVEGVVSLFTDDIEVEDPVGGPPGTHVKGREAVLDFFSRGFADSRPEPHPTGPVRTTASGHAAAPFLLDLDLRGIRHRIDVIDVVAFADDGRIRSLRAFWNPRDARRLQADA